VKLHCGNWARDEWPVWAEISLRQTQLGSIPLAQCLNH
jgi:hypothetical protein